jgi:hypothetical protein
MILKLRRNHYSMHLTAYDTIVKYVASLFLH